MYVAGAIALPEEQQLKLDTVYGYVTQQLMKKSVSVSDVGSVVWNEVQANAKLKVIPYTGHIVATELEKPPPFGWDDCVERSRADRYLPHMRKHLPMSTWDDELVDVANRHPTLLRARGLAKQTDISSQAHQMSPLS